MMLNDSHVGPKLHDPDLSYDCGFVSTAVSIYRGINLA